MMTKPDDKQHDDLDWNNLSDPVPMNLLDADFDPAVPDHATPGATQKPVVGPASGPTPQSAGPTVTPKLPPRMPGSPESIPTVPASVEWPMNAEGVKLPGSRSEVLPRETIDSLMAPTVAMPVRNRDEDHIPDGSMLKDAQEDYARMRAKVEAEALAEDEAKRKAERDEAAQQERLAQWMANARARLQQADAGPVPPGTKFRAKREASPTMIRMAEMQRTILDSAPSEIPGSAKIGSGESARAAAHAQDIADVTASMPGQSQDPMATIMVPKDQFVEGPATPTRKLKSLEKKVAQIRLADSGAETIIMAAPQPEPGRNNVRLAFWVLGGLIPIIFGLGLFALMQTGYLDGLEQMIPSFGGQKAASATAGSTASGRVTASGSTTPAPIKPAATSPGAVSASAAPATPATDPVTVGTGSKVTPALPQKPTPAAPTKPILMPGGRLLPTQPTAPIKPKADLRPAPAPRAPVPTPTASAKPAKASKPAKAEKAPVKPVPPAETNELPDLPSATTTAANALTNAKNRLDASMAGIEIAKLSPSSKSAASDAPGKGDAELKTSVAAAQAADAENMQAIYDRFAMNFPNLSGNVVIGLTVAPTGQIQDGRISTTSTGLADFDQEILHKVLEWKLSAFPDTQSKYVAVAFHFAPKSP